MLEDQIHESRGYFTDFMVRSRRIWREKEAQAVAGDETSLTAKHNEKETESSLYGGNVRDECREGFRGSDF